MTNRYSRHQAVINREKDAHIDDDYWFRQFEKNLEKSAVQSRKVDDQLFHQMNSIMNTKSKYPSVSAAVEDMMHRSGLTNYLKNVKVSETKKNKKIANFSVQKNEEQPEIIKKYPDLNIVNTLNNIINKGYLQTPAILDKLKRAYPKIDDSSLWDDPKLSELITKLNLEKRNENIEPEDDVNLGKHQMSNDFDYDAANDDVFHGLNPAKI